MAQQTINVGTVTNDGTGDPLRSAFGKANANFTELYGRPVFSGSYSDLTNKPTIPAAPNLAPYALTASLSAVALSGSYNDLTNKPTIPAAYTLPIASGTVLGGIRSSGRFIIAADGTIDLAQSGATTGQVLQWNGTAWTPATVSSGSSNYVLPTASASVLGGVKIGPGLAIDANSILSATATGGTVYTGTAPVVVSGSTISVTIGTASGTLAAGNDSRIVGAAQASSLAAVATSGAYADLLGRPSLATVATSGSYADLSSKPTIPVAGTTAGTYAAGNDTRITGAAQASSLATVATSGSYADLTNKPSIPVAGTTAGTYAAGNDGRITGAAQAASLATVATSGAYADLSGKPAIPVAGTTSGTYAAGNDSRIVGAAQAASLATVATSGSYADLLNKPAAYTLPIATTSVLGGVKAGTGVTVAADGTISVTASGSATLPVSSTYTASGAIALTDTFAVVNSASQCDMTLANGTTDGQRLIVKRYGAGVVTITLKLDGASGAVITANSGTYKEAVSLVWSSPLSSWVSL